MENIKEKKQGIQNKVYLMINDGISLDIPVETHITKLEEKTLLFSNQKYKKKEKETIDYMKALNNKNRLRIIQLLKTGAKCSCELEYALNLSQPTISHHINILEQANIVKIFSKGKWRTVQLQESPIIFWVLDQLK